jgi:hypothetical protein
MTDAEFLRRVELSHSRREKMIDGRFTDVTDEEEAADTALRGADIVGQLLAIIKRGSLKGIPCGKPMSELQPQEIPVGMGYTVYHRPTGELWYVIGTDWIENRICVAGWPPTIANIADCVFLSLDRALSKDEILHRHRAFGGGWT